MSDPVRGIGYDAGVIYEKSFDSRPLFSAESARRDFRAIRHELGCDAVLIMASDPKRLAIAAQRAAEEDLAVWLVVGCELTLSTPGMLPGPTFWTRGNAADVDLSPVADREPPAEMTVGCTCRRGARAVRRTHYREASNAWRFEDDLRAITEQAQADHLIDLLTTFDRVAGDGAFVWGFAEPHHDS